MTLSIITVNLNNAKGLQHTIDSVLAQTSKDYEFIIVDGGSADGSRDIILGLQNHLAAWWSEPDKGICEAMNKGLSKASGDYVCFMNSGDRFWNPTVLEQVFASPIAGIDLVYGDVIRTDKTGTLRLFRQPEQMTIARYFKFGFCHQSIFIKRDLFTTLGLHDETLKIAGDWDFTLRALMAGKTTRHIPVPVVQYEGSGISDTTSPFVHLREEEKKRVLTRLLPPAVYQDYLRLNELEKECGRMKQYEDWVHQIQSRNLFANIAMVTLWAWRRLTRAIAPQPSLFPQTGEG
jgi:glycosyltransferase involved in cell wall biosynthesis